MDQFGEYFHFIFFGRTEDGVQYTRYVITELRPQPKYLDLPYFNVVEILVFFQMLE